MNKELVILNNLSNKMNEVKNLGYSPLFIALIQYHKAKEK